MTDEKTEETSDETAATAPIAELPPEYLDDSSLPGTPSEWIDELTHHRKATRILRSSYARSKGSFVEHERTIVRWFDTKNPDDFRCFEVWLDGQDGTQTKVGGSHTAASVVAHVWKSLCQAGTKEARKHGLSRMRGELQLLDQEGEALNDASLSRKILDDADTASPTVSSEDEEVVKQMHMSSQLNRSMNAHLRAMESIDQSVIMKSQNLEKEMERVQVFGEAHAKFIEWQTETAGKHLDRAAKEARSDAVMAFAQAALAPKVPMLLDALAVGLRTGFGRVSDPHAVPKMPAKISLWLMSTLPEQYMSAHAATLKEEAQTPTSSGYAEAWAHMLALVDAAIAEHDCTDEGRRLIERWALSTCKQLGIDHHMFAHATFATHTDAETAHQERAERREKENLRKDDDGVNPEPAAPSE